MQRSSEKTSQKNYTTIALAEDVDLARDYVEMLRSNEIPAKFHANNDIVQGSRVAIMVPDDMVEQAQSLIQARCSGPDFYDYIYDDSSAGKNEEFEEQD
jgi:hypothetical protein